MNDAAPNRARSFLRLWSARSAAMVTALSMQFLWVGVLLCAVDCAKGACQRPLAAGQESTGSHCGHPTSPPGSPASGPHSRNCPAAYLLHAGASRIAVLPAQLPWAAQSTMTAVLPGAAMPPRPSAMLSLPRQENSPPQIAAAPTPIPLRI